MRKPIKLYFSSSLSTTKEELWNSICSFKALNNELAPVLKMTNPKNYHNIRLENFPMKAYAFISIILLFRFIPIDRYHVRLMRVIPNYGFIEISKSIFTSKWIHIRKISESENLCTIKDKLVVTPKNILFKPFIWLLIKYIFYTRHKNLKKEYEQQIAI